jgi:hypothetical protein
MAAIAVRAHAGREQVLQRTMHATSAYFGECAQDFH